MKQMVFLGGDARMQAASAALRREGYAVRPVLTAADAGLEACLAQAEVLVLPIPAFTSEGEVRGCEGLNWASLRPRLRAECLLCGGGLSGVDWPRKADFLADETFARANAVPASLAQESD